jgi:hypothetical protein
MFLNESFIKEKLMSCPYFKEGYFGICVAPDAIHVPSIDEMERLCFRSWYSICPNIAFLKGVENGGKSCAARGPLKLGPERLAGPLPAVRRDGNTGGSHR